MKNLMPLSFLADAVQAAKNELLNKVDGTCTVSCTMNCTVFNHQGKVFAAAGNLHDQLDAPYCIEFDLRYNNGNVFIQSQRIYQTEQISE